MWAIVADRLCLSRNCNKNVIFCRYFSAQGGSADGLLRDTRRNPAIPRPKKYILVRMDILILPVSVSRACRPCPHAANPAGMRRDDDLIQLLTGKPAGVRRRQALLMCRLASRLAVLLLLAIPPAGTAARDTGVEEVRVAAGRALDWIEDHRATPKDGGLLDMIDEGVSFRVFRKLARTVEERERFDRLFRSQMSALNQHVELERRVNRPRKSLFEHYHLVLAAHLGERAGQPYSRSAVIRDQVRQALTLPVATTHSVRLTTALFLARLDEQADVDIEPLLVGSLIERINRERGVIHLSGEATAPDRQRTTTFLLYALVHEVVALTDFGHEPLIPWLAGRRDAVVGVLRDAVTWAGARQNRDLVAELIVTLYFMNEPLHAEVRAALDELVASQLPDGSWGASKTTTRPNKVRHTVLTGAAALLAYTDWLTGRLEE